MTDPDLATRPTRAPYRRGLAGLAVLLLAAGTLAWLWRHPDQELPGGYGMRMQRPVGEPVWTALVHSGTEGAEEITITGLEPRFRTNGTRAEVDYVICELDQEVLGEERVSSFGYGGGTRELARFCARTRPAVGATFRLRAQPPEELLVGVTSTRPGRTVITGHRISFRVGWQVGSDDIGVHLNLRARPDAG